jgi:error-prone DNA polymerase
MPALALTDHDALYGTVSFWRSASQVGIKPIFGAEVTVGQEGGQTADACHLTLLAENNIGYANLSQLITAARMRCAKGRAEATWDDLTAYSQGLIALSGCRQGQVASYILAGQLDRAIRAAHRLRDLFGPQHLFIELQRQQLPGDQSLTWQLLALANHTKLPIVATNNVHYATQAGHRLHDVLVAIGHLASLDESHHQRRGNSEAYLKSAKAMREIFADRPDALARTLELAGRCHVTLHQGVQSLPRFPIPASDPDLTGKPLATSQQAYLRQLCETALAQRYGAEPGEQARQALDHELETIGRLDLANYFLIVWDIKRFARSAGIRCQGRGSAANSLVAYLLDITPINPLDHKLVFERFLSEERNALPDIDIDFDAQRREEVIQYVYQRYGRDHAAMACTLVTFRQRSAVRDVGRALGFPTELIDSLAAAVHRQSLEDAWGEVARGEEREAQDAMLGSHDNRMDSASWQLLLQLCSEIQGLPRHLGIHNGGMVLSSPPLARVVPVEPATMPGRTVCQWDKEALEDVGLVKIDLLGLRMLSALEEALAVIQETTGQRPDLDRLAFDDPAVYDQICRGDTIGCFQVESRAQAQLIPHFQPHCFNDLIVEISLIRPGPIQGNMVQPYLRRRQGKEPVTYLHPLLKPALAETLGVIVFQEQVLKVARDLAGFSGGQGELLRRALGRKSDMFGLATLRQAFLTAAVAKGVPSDVAATVFQQLEAFGSYAFAKSHAASFAVIVYQSAWLKNYYPLAFYIGLLRCQPMGFYSPAVLINDAKRHGIQVLPVDVNCSDTRYSAEFSILERAPLRLESDSPDPFRGLSDADSAAFSGQRAFLTLENDSPRTDSAPLSGQSAALQRCEGDETNTWCIRIGLNTVKGLGEQGADRIVNARGNKPFTSLVDFCQRTRLPRQLVERLIQAGALDQFIDKGQVADSKEQRANSRGQIANSKRQRALRRRELLWQLGLLDYEEDTLLCEQAEAHIEAEGVPAELPPLRPLEALAAELQVTGVSAGEHIVVHHRARLQAQGVLSSQELQRCQGDETVWVAGQVTVLQSPPTAKGFWFLTLEDEFGMINIIIRPAVAARYRRIWRTSPLLAVRGRVQREGTSINLLAERPQRLA